MLNDYKMQNLIEWILHDSDDPAGVKVKSVLTVTWLGHMKLVFM